MNTMNPLARLATTMIRKDHEMAMSLFHRIRPDTPTPVREALLRRLCTALEIHATLEEELFYPAVAETSSEVSVSKSVSEHDEMRQKIEQLRSMPADREAQDVVLCELMNGVMHHVAEEETRVLPQAEQMLGNERLAEIGARMTKRRFELAKPHAGEMSADLVRSSPGKTAMAAVAAVVVGALLLGRNGRHHASA